MENLKVIENDLVPVYETSTGEKVVSGRELHQVLESKQDFSTWVKKRIHDCDAIENQDFSRFHKKMEANNATLIEYIIKLDTAKEMAMLERNEKGKQVRRYFIEIEKKWKNQIADPRRLSVSEQIQLLALGNGELEQRIDNVEKSLQDFKDDMPLLAVECEKITNAVKRKGVNCLGGKDSNAYHDNSLRGKVYRDIHNEVKRQFGVDTYKALKRSRCDTAVMIIEEYKLPLALEEAVQNCNAQLSL